MDKVHPRILYESFVSGDFRKRWDRNLIDMEIAFEGEGGNDVVFQSFKYPFPLTNRDALYSRYRSYDEETGTYTIVWRR